MLLASLTLATAASIAFLPAPERSAPGLDAAIERALASAGSPPLRLEARSPCDDGCASAAARDAARERVVTARVRTGDGAVLVELHLLAASDGRQLAKAVASGLGMEAALQQVPAAVARLLAPAPARPNATAAAPRAVPPAGAKSTAPGVVESRTRPGGAWEAPVPAGADSGADAIQRVEERRRRMQSRRRAREERDAAVDLARVVEEVAADVEKARGLRRTRKLKYEILDPAHFQKALQANARIERDEVARTTVRWVAFGMARALADPGKIATDVLDEGVLGFYDPRRRTLYVRAEQAGPEALAEESKIRSVLAHEIEHALQDQNFGLAFGKGERDGQLARRALFEGDAMVAQAAYEAMHSRRTTRWEVGRRTAALRSVDLIQLAERYGYSRAVAAAPRIVQEEITFPYVWGFGLVSDVFRRGGFAAVNEMFRHPPRTTAQYFDTAAYLDGRGSIAVPIPAGLPGRPGDQGRLGVLGTKEALASCIDPNMALESARALLGDAYNVTRLDNDGVAVAWATAWRDAQAATVFKNLLEMERPCWTEQALAADAGELFVADDAYIEVDGARVVLVRGLPAAQARTVAARALRFDAAPPASRPPFAIAQGPLLADDRDELIMDKFNSVRLGLRARVPADFAAIHLNAADFAISSPARGVLAAISFVPESPTPQSRRDLFASYVGDVADWPGGLLEQPETQGTLWGRDTSEHSWAPPRGRFRLRISILPACRGRAYFAVIRASRGDDAAEKAVADWLGSVQTDAGDPPVCVDLE